MNDPAPPGLPLAATAFAETVSSSADPASLTSDLRGGVRIWRVAAAAERAATPASWPYHAGRILLALPWAAAVTQILERLGVWAEADRAWMFEYSPDLSLFRNTHEWCREGVPSHLRDLQNTPVTIMGEAQQHMIAGTPMMVVDVAAMPPSMRSLQVEFLRQSMCSTLTVPVHHAGQLRAAIGFDATRRRRAWSADVAIAMLRIAGMIGEARFAARPAPPAPEPVQFPPLVYLRTGRSVRGVPLESLVMLRADGDLSVAILTDGSPVTDLRPLKWWGSVLPPAQFVRLNRSAIVQVRRIASIARRPSGGWRAQIEGLPEPLSISRRKIPELRSRLGV